jgi:hypothetical protein
LESWWFILFLSQFSSLNVRTDEEKDMVSKGPDMMQSHRFDIQLFNSSGESGPRTGWRRLVAMGDFKVRLERALVLDTLKSNKDCSLEEIVRFGAVEMFVCSWTYRGELLIVRYEVDSMTVNPVEEFDANDEGALGESLDIKYVNFERGGDFPGRRDQDLCAR